MNKPQDVNVINDAATPVAVTMVPPGTPDEPGKYVKSQWAVFVRSPYNYDTKKASDESGIHCLDASLAVQDQRDEVDINTIVRRFGLTGKLPDDLRTPQYGDFDGITDYQTALNAVIQADEEFMRMPAELRARFQNNPAHFVDFCMDDKNRDEMLKLGLLKPGIQGSEKSAPEPEKKSDK